LWDTAGFDTRGVGGKGLNEKELRLIIKIKQLL
jgi:hypothetical protein